MLFANLQNFIVFKGRPNLNCSTPLVQNSNVSFSSTVLKDTFVKSDTDDKKSKNLDYLDGLGCDDKCKIAKARLRKASRRNLSKLDLNELLYLGNIKFLANDADTLRPTFQELNQALNVHILRNEESSALSFDEMLKILEVKANIACVAGNTDKFIDKLMFALIDEIEKIDDIDVEVSADLLKTAKTLVVKNALEDKDSVFDKLFAVLAKKLQDDGRARYNVNFNLLNECFQIPDTKIEGRIKSVSSIAEKLQDRFNNTKAGFNVFNMVPDVCGYRITSDGSKEKIEEILSSLEEAVDEGKLKPGVVFNRGNEMTYFTKENIERLENKGFTVVPKPWGNMFCANIHTEDKFGRKIEIQIIGDEVNKINKQEHGFYKHNTPEGKRFSGIPFRMLDIYEGYVRECYIYARMLELGQEAQKPKLPEYFDEDLALV